MSITMDHLPDEMPEAQLIQARRFSAALDAGAEKLGLKAKKAEIGLTESGRTAVIMTFRLTETAFTDA